MDTQTDALKNANKAVKEARKELDYYKGLAGLYQLHYDEQIEVSAAILIIKGITQELRNELNEYQNKNGQNERVAKSQKRLVLLGKQLGIISKVQTDYYILKLQNKTLLSDNHTLKTQIEDLERRLQLHTENNL